jgi:hypothetical protein
MLGCSLLTMGRVFTPGRMACAMVIVEAILLFWLFFKTAPFSVAEGAVREISVVGDIFQEKGRATLANHEAMPLLSISRIETLMAFLVTGYTAVLAYQIGAVLNSGVMISTHSLAHMFRKTWMDPLWWIEERIGWSARERVRVLQGRDLQHVMESDEAERKRQESRKMVIACVCGSIAFVFCLGVNLLFNLAAIGDLAQPRINNSVGRGIAWGTSRAALLVDLRIDEVLKDRPKLMYGSRRCLNVPIEFSFSQGAHEVNSLRYCISHFHNTDKCASSNGSSEISFKLPDNYSDSHGYGVVSGQMLPCIQNHLVLLPPGLRGSSTGSPYERVAGLLTLNPVYQTKDSNDPQAQVQLYGSELVDGLDRLNGDLASLGPLDATKYGHVSGQIIGSYAEEWLETVMELLAQGSKLSLVPENVGSDLELRKTAGRRRLVVILLVGAGFRLVWFCVLLHIGITGRLRQIDDFLEGSLLSGVRRLCGLGLIEQGLKNYRHVVRLNEGQEGSHYGVEDDDGDAVDEVPLEIPVRGTREI